MELLPAWVLPWVKGFGETLNNTFKESFILTRNAWVGTWRYGAALWSGDIPSTFSELAKQVTVGQGVALSGVALWTTDIGGYHGGNTDVSALIYFCMGFMIL